MHLSDAARALALRCEPRVNELARRMARGAFEDLPGYAELPGDLKDVEIAATVRHGLRLFLRRVRAPEGRHGDHGVFRERAAQRAEEGMPLHLLLRTHALGEYALWQALRQEAGPDEAQALIELGDLLFRAQGGILGAVAETYLDERAALDAERREHRRTLARGLLDGVPHRDPAALEELGLHGPATVIAVRLGPAPPEDAAPCAAPPREAEPTPVAVRRRLRRLQTALDREFGTEVLSLMDADGGHALVPGGAAVDDGLGERLRRACGVEVRCAAARAERPEGIPYAARTASEVVRIARACGRPAGLHRLDDVLLEYHLSRRDESSGPIAALLDPLDGRPELTETLRTHLEQRQDRRATARALGLHPNTVDNRLTRISELTGIDLTSPRGTALALAALLLRQEDPGGR
ncbi:PucR family transcriptional regulator [Streptomyces sp. NPDC018045]|uniref:PucR family transcriptional regulator n=1 Tax=Streptomyces sp. NPDC018045 TaxID=3365037 RepID=UPI0037919B3C